MDYVAVWMLSGVMLAFWIARSTFAQGSSASSKELCLPGNIFNHNLTLTGLNGTLQSPKKGLSYPPLLSCDWLITVPEGNIVKLHFDEFDVEWSSGCRRDYLEVFDGNNSNGNSIGKFCGYGPYAYPQSVRSSGRNMLIHFRSDFMSGGYERGFKLTFTAEDETICPRHRHVFTATASYDKTITSPSYPSNSESNLNCNWLLEVDSSLASDQYIVKVTFSDLEVACDDDAVKFYDGDNITVSDHRSYCGTTYPDVIYSTGRYLFVNFYTDNDYFTYRGFNFSFSAVKKEEASGLCRLSDGRKVRKLSGSSGTLITPDYPYNYPDDVRCTWIISVPAGKVVKLTFDRFRLNLNPDYCQTGINDYVQIRDGKSRMLAEYCGYYRFMGPSDVYSTGSSMVVMFISVLDGEEYSNGFKAHFEAVDPQSATSNYLCFSGNVNNNNLSLTGWSGVLQSPLRDSSYPPDLSCEWLITVPEWKIVKLSFDSFDLPSSGWGQCNEDYVEILDGKVNSSLSKGKFCGYNPGDMRSTGRYMRVRFKSDSDSTYSSYSGFKASFIAEDGPVAPTPANSKELCFTGNIYNGNLELTSTYGTLESPKDDTEDGMNYPPDSSCDWLITVPESNVVRLSFDRFDLEWSSECSSDYVEVHDGSSRYSRSEGRFCGSSLPADIFSTGRYMYVRFRSDSWYSSFEGFKATFTAEEKTSSSPSPVIVIIVVAVTVLVGGIFCVVCFKKKKRRNAEAEVRIPLSTITSSATYPTQPRVVRRSPRPSREAPAEPTSQLTPLPPVSYTPAATEPEVPPPAYPYPLEPPPPYPGEEKTPQYPPPGQSYPWQQTSSSAPVEPSAPPEDPV